MTTARGGQPAAARGGQPAAQFEGSQRRRSRTIFWTSKCWTVLLDAACCPFARSKMNLLKWNTMILHWFYKLSLF
jgi:hypothetical protein